MELADLKLKKMNKDELMALGPTLVPPLEVAPELSKKEMIEALEARIAEMAATVIPDGGNADPKPQGTEDVLEVMSPLVDPEFVSELEALAAEIEPRPPAFEYLTPQNRKWRQSVHDRLIVLIDKCQ